MPTDNAVPIRDRIKSFRRVRAGDIKKNPKNWRTHSDSQRAALGGVLAEIGYAGALIAREAKGGQLVLIDGHLRLEESAPDQKLPVLVLDVTAKEADKLLATMDPLGAMAGIDANKLDELLADLKFDDAGIDAMLRELSGGGSTPAATVEAPAEFAEFDESIPTEHTCPKCGYQWSGGK